MSETGGGGLVNPSKPNGGVSPMLGTPVLTEQQLGDFARDGTVLVRNGFDAAEAEQIQAWTQELAEYVYRV
jgi:hypothetical protein